MTGDERLVRVRPSSNTFPAEKHRGSTPANVNPPVSGPKPKSREAAGKQKNDG